MSFFFRIDDIEDSSILRRGIPVAHSIYGVASTINAANYAMIIAVEKCIELNHPEVYSLAKLLNCLKFCVALGFLLYIIFNSRLPK